MLKGIVVHGKMCVVSFVSYTLESIDITNEYGHIRDIFVNEQLC